MFTNGASMEHQPATGIERIRELAESLDCFIEEDFQALAAVKPGTAEAWRKRGTGPAYIRLGNRVLYEREAVRQFLQTLVRSRTSNVIGGLL